MSKRALVTSIALVLLAPGIVAAGAGRLCFTRGDYIFIKEPNGRIRRFVKGNEPHISPDGHTIAFVAVKGEWRNSHHQRSQKTRLTWERMRRLMNLWLPRPALHHPYPQLRLGVRT